MNGCRARSSLPGPGADTLLVYDADNGAAIAGQSIVLVGSGYLINLNVNSGDITGAS